MKQPPPHWDEPAYRDEIHRVAEAYWRALAQKKSSAPGLLAHLQRLCIEAEHRRVLYELQTIPDSELTMPREHLLAVARSTIS